MLEFHKYSSYRSGFASPLEHSCRSSVTLNLNKKGDGKKNYFYFLLGTREKEGRSLYYVIFLLYSAEIPSCLLFVLLLLSPSVFD